MKKTLLISGVLLALMGSVASAGGVNLAWNDCGLAGATDQAFACNTNSGVPFQLYASFEPNEPNPTCVSNEWVIDLESSGATLPTWWHYKGAGRCRDASMVQSTNFAAGPFSCTDPWGGAIGIQGFSYNIGFSGANTARIVGVQSLDAASPTAVAPGTEYYSFALIINRAKTVGTGACLNCLDGVCLVLNQIRVLGLQANQDISSPRDRNYATWQGGQVASPGCPLATPTRNSSWGQVKSLYR